MATFEYFDDGHPRCENAERVRLRTFIPSRGSCGGEEELRGFGMGTFRIDLLV